jgi:HAD superfamily hydrolase (TIGR01549 family)
VLALTQLEIALAVSKPASLSSPRRSGLSVNSNGKIGTRSVTTNGAPRDTAVIWDFDGTLVDSHRKNLQVNRTIISRLTGRPASSFEALSSMQAYGQAVARATNWREFYAREFELRDADVERAGQLWPELQSADQTPQEPFGGVRETLDELSDVSHGILSQNDSLVINASLDASGLSRHFKIVLGYAELGLGDQKPAAGGLLRCIDALRLGESARVFFIGDHVTDAMCAANARAALIEAGSALEVFSVGAFFSDFVGDESWEVTPDRIARNPSEIVDIVRNGRS